MCPEYMKNFKIILIITSIICLLIFEISCKSIGLFHIADDVLPIPSIILFLYYTLVLKGKNLFFLTFILLDTISLSFNFLSENNNITFYASMWFSIISFICFFIYIIKKIDSKILIKKHLPYAMILSVLAIYIVYSLNNSIFDNEEEWSLPIILTEVLYNITLTSLLIVSFINYAYNDSTKQLLLLLFCIGLVFSEIIYAVINLYDATKFINSFDVIVSILFFASYISLTFYLNSGSDKTNETLNSVQN